MRQTSCRTCSGEIGRSSDAGPRPGSRSPAERNPYLGSRCAGADLQRHNRFPSTLRRGGGGSPQWRAGAARPGSRGVLPGRPTDSHREPAGHCSTHPSRCTVAHSSRLHLGHWSRTQTIGPPRASSRHSRSHRRKQPLHSVAGRSIDRPRRAPGARHRGSGRTRAGRLVYYRVPNCATVPRPGPRVEGRDRRRTGSDHVDRSRAGECEGRARSGSLRGLARERRERRIGMSAWRSRSPGCACPDGRGARE